VSWRITADAGEFLGGAGGYLQADPVENTLLLTIADGARGAAATSTPANAVTLFGWRDSPPTGIFVHSLGWPVVLSSMTEAAATGLAVTLHQLGRVVTGVNGAPAAAGAFAAQWCQAAGPAAVSRVFQRQRLFRLGELTPPPPPPGRARVATTGDREQLIQWADAFRLEADEGGHPPIAAVVDNRLAYGGQLVWEAGGQLVSTAARTPVVGGMARIAPVYTPPGQRGHGYGGAVTVATSQAAREAGAREVVLFTDLANPTSNALYQRLGYRPVSDRVVLFVAAG
jgi:RimJ/RimL family protein N-acetyltransferase